MTFQNIWGRLIPVCVSGWALGLIAFLPATALSQDNLGPQGSLGGRDGGVAEAPESPAEGSALFLDFDKDSGLDALLGRPQGDSSPRITISSEYTIDAASGSEGLTGQLSVAARLKPNWHIYSVTQAAGGPQRTELTVTKSGSFQVTGDFVPDKRPRVRKVEYFTVPLEEHEGEVTWRAPLKFTDGQSAKDLVIKGEVVGQICSDEAGCVPLDGMDTTFAAHYADPTPVESSPLESPTTASSSDGFQLRRLGTHATIRGTISPRQIRPGGTLRLTLEAELDSEWYVYALAVPGQEYAVSKPTRIALQVPADWELGPVHASPEARESASGVPEEPVKRYHPGRVRWTIDVKVPKDLATGTYPLEGVLGFQTCSDVCDPPTAVRFSTDVRVGAEEVAGESPLRLAEADYIDSQRRRASSGKLDLDNLVISQDELSLAYVLVLAFLGGFILNFMPCVLPVIGLKIMSFVQQAGEDRRRILTLNLWYVLGILSIFMLLATLAAVASLGWGEQFNFDAFNIVLIAVVFTMGLSFMGVWEIPIPGFVGGGKADAVAQREGPLGAFTKGVLTTILATPCSGPGLATALAWAAGKPPHVVYGIFACMGLGMGVPYLVLGMNPKLVRFLPKPGAWMETFKQLMGLVLLATSLYLLTLVSWVHVFPTLALLLALAAGCWWIGRVPVTASANKKTVAWISVCVFCVVVGVYAFGDLLMVGQRPIWALRGTMRYRLNEYVDAELNRRLDEEQEVALSGAPTNELKNKYELPWERFSTERLAALTEDHRTVLVDFTARWCLTCKFLEAQVLNTPKVRELVDANEVVTLIADWSDRDPEGDVGKLLAKLGSRQVPVLAIFPAGRPNEPIVLMGGYKQRTLLRKLKDAGPSDPLRRETTTASLK